MKTLRGTTPSSPYVRNVKTTATAMSRMMEGRNIRINIASLPRFGGAEGGKGTSPPVFL